MYFKLLKMLGFRSDSSPKQQLDIYNTLKPEQQKAVVDAYTDEDFRYTPGTSDAQRALTLWRGGQREQALEAYDTAIEQLPKDSSLLLNRANLKFELGRYADAASDYDRAMQALPPLPPEVFVNYQMIQTLGIDSPVLKILAEKKRNAAGNA